MRVDKKFDEIMLKETKLKIAEAFLDLESQIRISELGTLGKIGENSLSEIVKEKANQMKQELNQFIDSQVDRIIGFSDIQEYSTFSYLFVTEE